MGARIKRPVCAPSSFIQSASSDILKYILSFEQNFVAYRKQREGGVDLVRFGSKEKKKQESGTSLGATTRLQEWPISEPSAAAAAGSSSCPSDKTNCRALRARERVRGGTFFCSATVSDMGQIARLQACACKMMTKLLHSAAAF